MSRKNEAAATLSVVKCIVGFLAVFFVCGTVLTVITLSNEDIDTSPSTSAANEIFMDPHLEGAKFIDDYTVEANGYRVITSPGTRFIETNGKILVQTEFHD